LLFLGKTPRPADFFNLIRGSFLKSPAAAAAGKAKRRREHPEKKPRRPGWRLRRKSKRTSFPAHFYVYYSI
jgi:hypothetical protein